MKRTLGYLERQLFAYTQLRKLQTLRTRDLTDPLGISSKQERELLSRLSKAGMIAQVRRGLYLVPERLPLGGKWTPDGSLALRTLVADRKGSYQICGPNAFNYHGLDNQVPNRIYAYNNKVSGERSVGKIALVLIKVAGKRLGEVVEVPSADGPPALYSSRVRTLVDAVYDWSRFNSLPRGFDWIRENLARKRVGANDLVRVTLAFGDVGTIRRIGALLEQCGANRGTLRKLKQALKPSSSLIPWDPTRSKRGVADPYWGVVRNEKA